MNTTLSEGELLAAIADAQVVHRRQGAKSVETHIRLGVEFEELHLHLRENIEEEKLDKEMKNVYERSEMSPTHLDLIHGKKAAWTLVLT